MSAQRFALDKLIGFSTLLLLLGSLGCSSGDSSNATPPDQTKTNEQCKALDEDACHSCCLDAYPSEWKSYQTDYSWPCICKPGNCDTQCASSACAIPAVSPDDVGDDTCNACLEKSLDMGGDCMAASVNCLKDDGCGPVLKCLMGCR